MTETQKTKIIKMRSSGASYGSIAEALGIPLNTVKSFCRRNVVKNNAVYAELSQCENCGTPVQQLDKRKKKRFCSDKCRNAWWNSHLDQVDRKALYELVCPYCGKPFHIYGDKRRKYCSHKCYIAHRFGAASNEG